MSEGVLAMKIVTWIRPSGKIVYAYHSGNSFVAYSLNQPPNVMTIPTKRLIKDICPEELC